MPSFDADARTWSLGTGPSGAGTTHSSLHEPALTAGPRDVVKAHVETLVSQLARIIADGVSRRELSAPDLLAAARAVFDATARLHNPVHAPEWSDPGIDAGYERVRALVLGGLTRTRARSG